MILLRELYLSSSSSMELETIGEPDLSKTILLSPRAEELPTLAYTNPRTSLNDFSTFSGSLVANINLD